MKKPKLAPKKAHEKRSGPSPQPESEFGAHADLIAGMSPEQFAEFLGSDDFGDDAVADLFEQFLELSRLDDPESEDLELIVDALTAKLGELRLAAEGGAREARKERDDFLARVEDAAGDPTLSGRVFMLIAKIMSDAGWRPPESLKRASAASLEGPDASSEIASLDPAASQRDLTAALMELLNQVGDDEFAVYSQLTSMFSAFPAEVAACLLGALAKDASGEINRAIAGFALHSDDAVAIAALEALARSSAAVVDSQLVERLVRMRPWASEARRHGFDAAIRTLRPKAGPPVAHPTRQLRKVQLSACDGSGAHSVIFAFQDGRRHDACAVLLKPEGIDDLMFIDDVGKAGVDSVFDELRTTAATCESDVAGAQEMLSIALAGNLQANVPPPYNLVRLVERLGLGPLTPDLRSTAEIAEQCLVGASHLKKDQAARIAAHQSLVDDSLIETWFEAGEEVADLLEPIESPTERFDILMKDYLPGRRAKWARLCALSALALRGPAGRRPAPNHYELAIVALELLSETPIEDLPLMEAIASATMNRFEGYD